MLSLGGRWKELAGGIATAVRRFPLPLAASLTGAVTGCVFVSTQRYGVENGALRVLMTCALGVSPFLAAALVGARRRAAGWALSAVVAALLGACYLGLAGNDEWTAIRFALFMLAAHAVLALAPLWGKPRGDFRPFNLMLFARTALALLLTHVLYAGLCFALAAVEHLFDVHVPSKLYGQLWFVLMGVFNTAYVLAGIPVDWDRLEGRFPTPRALDVLARLVLLPLSILYLAILYVYSVKIIVVHQWPRGWVSAPVIVFAAIGMLTVLLLDPDRLARSRLARAYCRGFFVALLPLVVLLFLAISRRAFEYGLTEERCLVYAVAFFLALIAPYFVLSRARNLWAIPLVLAGIAVLTAVGPLSARSLAVRSQTRRLETLLRRHHRLEHGVLVRGREAVPRKDEHEIGAALAYLESRHALGPVLAWRPEKRACSGCASLTEAAYARDLAVALGLTYRPWRDDDEAQTITSISAPVPDVVETAGFEVVLPSLNCSGAGDNCRMNDLKLPRNWSVALENDALVVTDPRHARTRIPLADLERASKAELDDDGNTQRKPLVRDGRGATLRYRLYVGSAVFDHGQENGPVPRVTSLSGVLLLGRAEPR
ncbi:MAG TPA: DUF4153 domain-containing protein [Polyangia bacterium]|nr:DUF4153 domain-containing protein [Polyangia bacterium]